MAKDKDKKPKEVVEEVDEVQEDTNEVPEEIHRLDAKIAVVDGNLEILEGKRLEIKAKGKELMLEKLHLSIRREIILRYLSGSPFTVTHTDWQEANAEEWESIKSKYRSKKGTRKAQRMAAGG